jgi:uncharacterized protein (DUF305 family)
MTTVRVAGVALVAASLFLGGCGGAAATHIPSGSGYNPADLAFSQQMIPHHLQTIQLAELAEERSDDAYVRQVAAKLKTKERDDIELMSSWLRSWGAAVPSAPPRKGHTMPGMLTPAQLTALERREGEAFDRLWLSALATHLGSGITMAETVRAGGQHKPTAALVDALIAEQSALIAELGQRVDQE